MARENSFPRAGPSAVACVGVGWAGGGGGVSSPVIFKEVYRKAPGVSCTPQVLSSTVRWRSQPPSRVTVCGSQSPHGTVTFSQALMLQTDPR